MKFLIRSTCLLVLIVLSVIFFHAWINTTQILPLPLTNPIDDLPKIGPLPLNAISIIPMPLSVQIGQGRQTLLNNFRIVSNAEISSEDLRLAIARYSKYISLIGKISVQNHRIQSAISDNELLLDCSAINFEKVDPYPHMGEDEAYQLTINSTGSYLLSSSVTGFIRGLSTFVQLIQHDSKRNQSFIHHVRIVDQPRFVWRGLMIDVCRHWIPLQVIERTIDAMEMNKMNVLHLHLSDDQGFRVESHRYPLLHDRKDFFTQKDIQHLVEYARKRRIRIIPEFDIPGHTTSWFIGYPELATEPRQYEIEKRWGVSLATMDPTKENTYEFLDGFFEEVTKLFPDDYFHIGGDEVEGSQWLRSPSIQNFIQKNQLNNKNGLQAFFNIRVENLLKKYKKILIGWEEIIEDPNDRFQLVSKSIIQSWKNPNTIGEGVKRGYRSIRSHDYYLDYMKSANFFYQVDPIPQQYQTTLNDEQRKRILGGEACVWTEYISEHTIDRRIWPRVVSIAERLWSPSSLMDASSMYPRLFRMSRLLDEIQIGLTHYSTYQTQLKALILDKQKKKELLHPLMILADACEPLGIEGRGSTGYYSLFVPLTTFTDALQPESEFIWKLETMSINNQSFSDIFQTWLVNHIRLRSLFTSPEKSEQQKLWVQDVERLSTNLATVGEIGLRILNYMSTGVLHSNPKHAMNQMSLDKWIAHHKEQLHLLRDQVAEIQLAAVRPVLRLLNTIRR